MKRSADWLDQAKSDLTHAQHDLDAGYFDWACFSAQQAAEKGVKAVFQEMGAETWGHSVADLLEELKKSRKVPDKLIELGLELDKVYIPSRYPNAHPSGSPMKLYTKNEARQMVGNADQIITFCESILSSL